MLDKSPAKHHHRQTKWTTQHTVFDVLHWFGLASFAQVTSWLEQNTSPKIFVLFLHEVLYKRFFEQQIRTWVVRNCPQRMSGQNLLCFVALGHAKRRELRGNPEYMHCVVKF
jgi:hypothetical protein